MFGFGTMELVLLVIIGSVCIGSAAIAGVVAYLLVKRRG
jgi:hypothetical protein